MKGDKERRAESNPDPLQNLAERKSTSQWHGRYREDALAELTSKNVGQDAALGPLSRWAVSQTRGISSAPLPCRDVNLASSTKSHNTTTEMGREDQKEEREVLDSIFPDEITGALLLAPRQSIYAQINLEADQCE